MRSIRQEALSVVVALATPAALLAVFPYGVFGFKAVPLQIASKPSAAFVHLTVEEEADALKAAKTSWQAEVAADREMKAYLPLRQLPEDVHKGPILGDDVWIGQRMASPPLEYGTPAWSPSQAADAPERISAEAEEPRPPAFSRESLLEITSD